MGTNHVSTGRRETSNNAVRRRGHVHDENRRPRYNYRIPYPPRGHPTYLPYPSLIIATDRTGPNMRHRVYIYIYIYTYSTYTALAISSTARRWKEQRNGSAPHAVSSLRNLATHQLSHYPNLVYSLPMGGGKTIVHV